MTTVAVVGGGIIGLSLALELRRGGAEVTLLDRSEPGQQASVAAGGLLAPQLEATEPGPFLDACLRSRAMYPRWVAQLEAETGERASYLESGILHAAFDEAELHAAEAWGAWQQAVGLRAPLLSAAEARALCPTLSPKILGALHLPDDHQVDPQRLVPLLVQCCQKAGVTLLRAEARGIAERAGRAIGVDVIGARVTADHVVVAAGPWSGLLEGAPVGPALAAPVRGQLIELRPETPIGPQVLGCPSVYVIPREDGRVLAGSTKEHVGFDTTPQAYNTEALLAAARRVCPALEGAPVQRTWAALRPWARDAMPVLGPGPLEGLWLSTAHFRNGILLAPLSARLMSDAILTGAQDPLLRRFRYERLCS